MLGSWVRAPAGSQNAGQKWTVNVQLLQYLDIVGVVFSLSGFVQLLGDPLGVRTQDPNIKSVVLYLLS